MNKPTPSRQQSESTDRVASLNAELEAAREQLARVTAEYEESLADQDTIQEDRDANAVLVNEAKAVVARLEAALASVDEGSYGRCQRCGNTIPEERLAALPGAVTCVSCA